MESNTHTPGPSRPSLVAEAIMQAAEAGKLRVYVRQNGGLHAGLSRLADRRSASARALLSAALRLQARGVAP